MKLLGAVAVGLAVYYSAYLTAQEHTFLKNILAVIAAILFILFDPIADEINRLRKRKKRLSIIQHHVNAFRKFLKQYTAHKINSKKISKELVLQNIDYEKREIIYSTVVNLVAGLSNVQSDGILLIALCNEIDSEKDILKTDNYKTTVAAIFEKYDFLALDEDARTLVRYHENFRNKKKLTSEIAALDYVTKTNDFTKKYNKTFNLTLQLKLEKDQAEEFRKTLAILISTGKLNIEQIEQNIQSKLSAELKTRTERSKAFLVLANRFHKYKEVEAVLNKFPNVAFPFKRPHNLPDSIKYLHTRIIYPPENYQSASHFLEQEIKPLIPVEKLSEGFIAIIPIEGTEMFSLPSEADDIKHSYMKEGFESITAYKTGVSLNLTEIYIESMQDEINIDEILSAIPFNIFVPQISQFIKRFIISNYELLKNHFGINRLSDWAAINKNDLRDKLIELDVARQKRRLYVNDNWEKLASDIVDKATEHRNAINNQ